MQVNMFKQIRGKSNISLNAEVAMCNVQVNICSNKFECNRVSAKVLGMCIFENGGRCNIDASFLLVSFLSWDSPWGGQVTCLLVKSLERKMGLWVLFDARELLSLCPLSRSFWTIRTWNSPEESTGQGHQLERWNSSRISKEDKDFFQSITSYNHRSMLFHNRNQIVNLYWCIF